MSMEQVFEPELNKVYSQFRKSPFGDFDRIQHIVRVENKKSPSGWTEFGFLHEPTDRCITCCTWSDEEIQELIGSGDE